MIDFNPDDYCPTAPWVGRHRLAHRPPKFPTLAQVVEVFERWLYLPDLMPLLVLLAVVAAHRQGRAGPSALLEGATSIGKTVLTDTLDQVEAVAPRSRLNAAGVLTADKPRRGRAVEVAGLMAPAFHGCRPGPDRVVVARPGFHPILVVGEFTTLTGAMANGSTLMGDLRPLIDGNFAPTLHGYTYQWPAPGEEPLVTIIGATTSTGLAEVLDDFGGKGQRFVSVRLTETEEDRIAGALAVIERRGDQSRMRADLATTVARFFEGKGTGGEREAVAPSYVKPMAHLAAWATRARSVVPRGRDLTMTGPAELESAKRMSANLTALWGGGRSIGLTEADTWALVQRVALDSIPLGRAMVLATLGRAAIWWTTSKLADELGWSTALAGRELEDLAAHGVVDRESGTGGEKTWRLAEGARAALVPDGLVEVADAGPVDAAEGARAALVPDGLVEVADAGPVDAEPEPATCSICGFACDPDLNPHPGCAGTGGAF